MRATVRDYPLLSLLAAALAGAAVVFAIWALTALVIGVEADSTVSGSSEAAECNNTAPEADQGSTHNVCFA